MPVTVEDLCNAALRRVGHYVSIGSIYDGSKAARVALDYYAQTRDNLFGLRDWPFLRRSVSLGAPLKSAPPAGYGAIVWTNAYPPLPWLYEYAYPANCIEVRSVRPTPVTLPEYVISPNIFINAYDDASGNKVVLTNLANAQAVITAEVTNPNEWQDNNFSEALINSLAELFAKYQPAELGVIQELERDKMAAIHEADMRRG